MRRVALALAALLVLAFATGAAKKARAPKKAPEPPVADSVTVALWPLDENGGPTVADAGPFRLRGAAGPDTRTDFGRFKSARVFKRAQQSFVVVPRSPALDVEGAFTVEAWVQITSWSESELQVVAARWSPVPGEQSWLLGVTGTGRFPGGATGAGGSLLARTGAVAGVGRLVFLMQPAAAASPVSFATVGALPLERWTHVAATVDGTVVRLYVDGRLDSHHATPQTVRPSAAPLVVGNFVDERRLSDISGQMQIEGTSDYSFYYGFDGVIDEVRLSNTARTRFESLDTR